MYIVHLMAHYHLSHRTNVIVSYHTKFRTCSGKEPTSIAAKKMLCDIIQCSNPLIAISGIANRYGSDKKYVDLCNPLGALETLNPFRTYEYDDHSFPSSIHVNRLLHEK